MRFQPPSYEAVPSIDAMVATMDRTVSGLDVFKRRLALVLRRFMVAATKDHDRPPHNVLVLGPSGGGKTHTIRQLLNAIPVISTEADATSFSDVGYVGRDLTSMYLGLLAPKWRGKRGEDQWTSAEAVSLAERWGVTVLDEFDKLNAPARPREGERQVGRAIQAELLKLVEGVDTLAKRNDDDRGVMLNTTNILHIAVGAFQGLNLRVARRDNPGLDPMDALPDAYMKSTIFDIIGYGFSEELVGRFSTILTLPPLDAGHMARILREHVIPDFERQCADDGITLMVDDGAISAISSRASGLPIGARALAPMVDDCLAINWGMAVRGDQIKLTADSVRADASLLVRPVAA
jgi:ATP-dependent Clp protease ATP-binding subunit ClpX